MKPSAEEQEEPLRRSHSEWVSFPNRAQTHHEKTALASTMTIQGA